MKKLMIVSSFLLMSVYLHRLEVFEKSYIYSDNFYHYVIYHWVNEELLKKDLLVTRIKSTFISFVFNPVMLLIYKLFLNFLETPKIISTTIGILVQLFFSFSLFKFLKKLFPEEKEILIFKFSLLGICFFSLTDVFFGDLRRNIAFLFFSMGFFNLYLNKRKLSFFYFLLYLFFYSVSFHLVVSIIIFFFLFDSHFLQRYKSEILILFLIFNFLLFYIPTPIKEKILLSFKWKDFCNNANLGFIETYIFNFNEYFEVYRFLFYFTVGTTGAFILGFKMKFNEMDLKTLKLMLFSLLSFILVSIIFSPSLASRQVIFAIPMTLLFLFLNKLYVLAKRFTLLVDFFLVFFMFFFIINETSFHYTKIDLELMEKIKEKTNSDDLLLVHPEDFFVPYFTKRNTYVIKDLESLASVGGKYLVEEVIRRYEIATDIFYTSDLKVIRELIEREKINYILVSEKYYDYTYLNGYNKDKEECDKVRKMSAKKYFKNNSKKFIIKEISMKEGEKVGNGYYLLNSKKIKYIYDQSISRNKKNNFDF